MVLSTYYLTFRLKDLIAETSRNSFKLNESAKNGDPKACFQMGMVYLLGINTAIDFKKAKLHFSSQSLLNDHDSQRMLGFLSELDGDYSSAFMSYAKAAGSAVDDLENSYIEKVIQEREALRDWLNKWKLPTRVLNNAITTILKDYAKGGDKKEEACIEIAAICQDTVSCIIAAQILSESGDYSDAMQWLQIGAVENNNPMYQKIESKLNEINSSISLSDILEVIEIEGCSLLSGIDIAGIFAPARNALNEISTRCSRLWRKEVMPKIETIKNKWEKEEKNRIKKEVEEERARLNRLKKEEEEALLEAQQEKEARKKKLKLIFFVGWFIFSFVSYWVGSPNPSLGLAIIYSIAWTLMPLAVYYFVSGLWDNIKKKLK